MKIAAFTMVRDDEVFLRLWLDYYGRQLGRDHLFVIDHGSEPAVAAPRGVAVVRLPRDPLDEIVRSQLVTDFNGFLLSSFDASVFSDADEILVPDPAKYEGLRSYVERNAAPLVAGVGLALVHRRDRERPIDLRRPILRQRRYVRFHGLYGKPLISRDRTQWRHGFHGARSPFEIDPDLYLFHLKAMDYGLAHRMLDRRRGGPQSARMVEKRHSSQFRMDPAAFDAAYFGATSAEAFDAAPDDFDFAEELARHQAQPEPDHGYGSLRRVPERMRRLF